MEWWSWWLSAGTELWKESEDTETQKEGWELRKME